MAAYCRGEFYRQALFQLLGDFFHRENCATPTALS
jgi:hypothetical protein